MHLKLFVMFISSLNIYNLLYFNQTSIKGNVFTNAALLSSVEFLGVLSGNTLLSYMDDHKAVYASYLIQLAAITTIKLVDLEQQWVSILFLI